MPPPSIWGPPLWKVLHTISHINEKLHPSLKVDSERESIWILNHIEYIIPCKECNEHVFEYKKKYPVPKAYSMLGEWVCNLHNSVNVKLEKDIHAYAVEVNATAVAVENIVKDWESFLKSIEDSILLGLVKGPYLREFTRHVLLWIRYSK